jgi:cytoskeletal protein CcmA (bactofilin family)
LLDDSAPVYFVGRPARQNDDLESGTFNRIPTCQPKEAEIMETPKTTEVAHIGKSVIIKGELSGSEDLYVDGQVEGNIELHGNSLTVGPHGQVRANVNAKSVIVQGKLEGSVRATDRTELRKSAVITGDIATQRISIEDGAYFKGKVDIQKEGTPSKS